MESKRLLSYFIREIFDKDKLNDTLLKAIEISCKDKDSMEDINISKHPIYLNIII